MGFLESQLTGCVGDLSQLKPRLLSDNKWANVRALETRDVLFSGGGGFKQLELTDALLLKTTQSCIEVSVSKMGNILPGIHKSNIQYVRNQNSDKIQEGAH